MLLMHVFYMEGQSSVMESTMVKLCDSTYAAIRQGCDGVEILGNSKAGEQRGSNKESAHIEMFVVVVA